MNQILERIDRLISREQLPWDRAGNALTLSFHDGRQQRVHIAERDGTLQLSSTVLPAKLVRSDTARWHALALRVWRKNAHADLVGFTFDRTDRLIAFADHPTQSLQDPHLRLLTESVARSADHLEHLLLREDRS